MFYQFNSITQSLAPTTQDVATRRIITPQSFSTNLIASPEIHYEYKPLKAPEGSSATLRHGSTSASVQVGQGKYEVPASPNYRKLMELQTRFLANDGKLVWQKLPMDKGLYFVAAVGTLVAVGLTVQGLYKLISPPKN